MHVSRWVLVVGLVGMWGYVSAVCRRTYPAIEQRTQHAPDEDGTAEQIEQQHEQPPQQSCCHRCSPYLVADADV